MYRLVGSPAAAAIGAARWGLRLRTATAVITAVACVLVAGCTSSAGTTNADGSCATPGITRDRVHLGLLYPDSGAFASTFAGVRGGVDARIETQNAQGGVHGRSITYDWADDGDGTGANLVGARLLVEQRNAFAIIEGTTNEDGSADYLAQHGIPVTGGGPSAAWSTYPNMFGFSALTSPTGVTTAWGEAARERGGTKVAVLAFIFIPSSAQLADGIATSMEAAGLDVVYENVELSQTTNLADLAAAVAQSDADVVTGGLPPEIWAALAPILRSAGADIKVSIFPNGYDRASLSRLGAALAGTNIATVVAPFELNLPGHRAYLDAMMAYAPHIQPAENQFALNGWLSADVMIRGLQESGACPTRESFIANLRKVTYDGNGLLHPALNLGDFREPNRCIYLVQVSADGHSYQHQGTEPVCGQIHPRT